MATRHTTYDYLFPIGFLLACRVLDLITEHACEVFTNLSMAPAAGVITGYAIVDSCMLIAAVLSNLAAELQVILCWFIISLSTELTTELWLLSLSDLVAGIQCVWNSVLMQRFIHAHFRILGTKPLRPPWRTI
ncbi:MAG: hypothetical protein ACXV3U_02935 [Halobacteriota archaeon]